LGWRGMWHAWEEREMHVNIWKKNLNKGNHLEDINIDCATILKRMLNKYN
jgi:hypothetical protein